MARSRKTPPNDKDAAGAAEETVTDDSQTEASSDETDAPEPEGANAEAAGAESAAAGSDARGDAGSGPPADAAEPPGTSRAPMTEDDLNRELGSLTAVEPGPAAAAAEEDVRSDWAEAEPDDARPVPVPPPPARAGSASVIPLLLGGVMAALIGFLVARYMDDIVGGIDGGPTPEDNAAALVQQADALARQEEALTAQSAALAAETARLSEQAARLDTIRATLEDLTNRDIAGEIAAVAEPLGADIDSARTAAAERFEALQAELAAVSERVATIAMRPQAPTLDPEAFDEALRDFRSELRAAIGGAHAEIAAARQEAEAIYAEAEAEFRTEFNAALEQARAEVAAARAEAEEVSNAALRAERAAEARAAWSRVTTALDNGTPYAEPLDVAASALSLELPDAVAGSAVTGIPTLAALQEGFPEAARAALGAAVRETTGDGTMDRLTAFLRVQSGVRSLEPREGDDPDAVLSRAEAALRAGDIDAALAELGGLPEAGQAALADWRAAAETRRAALAAADTVAQQIEAN